MTTRSSRLRSLVSITKGRKHDEVQDSPVDGSKRYIQIDDLRNNHNLKFTTEAGVHVKADDVIIAWDGANAGTIGFGLEGFIGSTLARLRILDEQVEPKYLGWFLRGKSPSIREKCYGATIPHVNRSILELIDIPLPPLPIQKQIAAILEKADAAREKRRQANQLTEQFLQSAFLEMFGDPVTNPEGWEVMQLEKCCARVVDGTHFPPKFSSIGIPFIFVSNIRNGEITLETEKYITNEEYKQLTKRCPVEIGDVLFTIVGSYGNAAVVRTNKPFSFQRHIAHIKPNYSMIQSEYLSRAMESPRTKQQVDQQVRGVAQKTLNLRELREVKICLPPLVEQQKFATLVERVDLLRAKQRESEKDLEELFQSLMQKAFRGELCI